MGFARFIGWIVVIPLVMAADRPPAPSALAFSASDLRFGSSGLTFPTAALSFPSHLERTETPTTIEIVLPADLLFDFDKADIRSEAVPTMHEIAGILRDSARGPVAIVGFTDALGADAYNQKLSERRAMAVKAWLVAREGLPNSRFSTAGLGARNPVAPNRQPNGADDPEGRQRNRRVTLTIRK